MRIIKMALRIAERGRTALLVELPRPLAGQPIAKVRTRRARVNNAVQRRVNELDPQGERYRLPDVGGPVPVVLARAQ